MKQADQRRVPAPGRSDQRRRRVRLALTFVSLALALNALVGERGLVETLRARRQHRALTSAIATLRAENGRLREEARRLREDVGTIEALARRELGLLRPGEILVVVRDITHRE